MQKHLWNTFFKYDESIITYTCVYLTRTNTFVTLQMKTKKKENETKPCTASIIYHTDTITIVNFF